MTRVVLLKLRQKNEIGDDVTGLKRIKGLRGCSEINISITQPWHDDDEALPAPSAGGVGPGGPRGGVGLAGGDVKLHVHSKPL